MMKKLLSILVFILPSPIGIFLLRICGHKIGKGCKIGFSWIEVKTIVMERNSVIGHLNLIKIKELRMGEDARIKKLNRIHGNLGIHLASKVVINQFNKISNPPFMDYKTLQVGNDTIIGVSHIFDVSSNIIIGENSILAGTGSQIWTHGFYHSKKGNGRWLICGDVSIGDNVYIATSVIICAGVKICDSCTIGAGVTIAKSITQSGMYVNQPLRYIEFDSDVAATKLEKVNEYFYRKK